MPAVQPLIGPAGIWGCRCHRHPSAATLCGEDAVEMDPKSAPNWETSSALTGSQHDPPSSSRNQTLMGHLGSTKRTLRVDNLTRWRVGRSSGKGANSYSSSAGHAFPRASIHSGMLAFVRENHKGQCTLLLEAKRSTSALSKPSHICCSTSGCNLHSPGGSLWQNT